MQKAKYRARTVGQVSSHKPVSSNTKRRWRKSKVTEGGNFFPTLKFSKRKLDTAYYGNEEEVIISLYRAIYKSGSNMPVLPAFNSDSTYNDVLLDLQRKVEKIFKKQKKINPSWDNIFFDGKDIVLTESINDSSMFFPLEVINMVDDEFKVPMMYIFGAILMKYNVWSFAEDEGVIQSHLDFMIEGEDFNKKELESWTSPKDIKTLGKGKTVHTYYDLAKECIEAYSKGNPSMIEDKFNEHHDLAENKSKAIMFDVFATAIELLKEDFNINDFITPYPNEDEELQLYPEEYCMVVPNLGDVFNNYEFYLNEKAGNFDIIPFTIEKRYTENGIVTNRHLDDGFNLLSNLSDLLIDLYHEK